MSPGYSFRRLGSLVLLLSVFAVYALMAQGSSTIRGQVVDATSGAALPGANVMLANTSIGTATDLDGNYILRLIPPGPWTLKASYVGYASGSEEIVVAENASV